MPNTTILEPVTEHDPCGRDLRWDAEFLALIDAFTAAEARGAASIVEGELVESPGHAFDEVVDRAIALSARTKDIRVLAVYAEASWHQAGLAAFADAMTDLVTVQERWPGAEHGVHPRADESDGDLGERAAALGKLLNRIPTLVATIGWSTDTDTGDRAACAARLRSVFGAWNERLRSAFGDQLPSVGAAWQGLQQLVGRVLDLSGGGPDPQCIPPTYNADAWDLIDQAMNRMTEQDHHSPALPLLRLLSTWRALGIIEIVEGMRGSGVTLEQLLESVKRQVQPQ